MFSIIQVTQGPWMESCPEYAVLAEMVAKETPHVGDFIIMKSAKYMVDRVERDYDKDETRVYVVVVDVFDFD